MRTLVCPCARAAVLACAWILSTGAATAQSAPLVTTPSLPEVVRDPVGTVNDTTGQVTDTVNGTVGDVQDTVGNAPGVPPVGGGSSGGSTGTNAPGGPPASTGDDSSRGSSPSSGGGNSSGGGGNSSSGSGDGGGDGPTARDSGAGARTSGSRRAQQRRRARRAASRRARRADDRAGARGASRGAARGKGSADAGGRRGDQPGARQDDQSSNPVVRVIARIEHVIPGPVKIAIALMALLALALGIRARLAQVRNRRLERDRQGLLVDVGALQRALLADVPDVLRGIDVSVAYRPADGPAAGGDFYDVFELEGNRTAIIVGDVCGHGRAALAVTALMRYTLRAYISGGLEPRLALELAGRALESDPGSALTTAVVAVYDPAEGTLTYACAGHAPPIVLGPAAFQPVTVFSSPPLGGCMPTGQRQTTIGLPAGSIACFFTDGLVEARLDDELLGRERLSDLVADLELDAGAQALVDGLAARADLTPDDMAACLVRAHADAAASQGARIEELDASAADLDGGHVAEFLRACGLDDRRVEDALRTARAHAAEFGGAMMRVVAGDCGYRVEATPRGAAPQPAPASLPALAAIEVPA